MMATLDTTFYKFLTDFMNSGTPRSIYEKRLSILYPIYNTTNYEKPKVLGNKDTTENTIMSDYQL